MRALLAAWDAAAKACVAVKADAVSAATHDAWLRADLDWVRLSGLSTTYAVSMGCPS